MGACGAGATLQAGPRGPGPSFSLAISLLWGEGRGISVTPAPHHCLIAGQHLHGLKLEHNTLCTPGSPGLSTKGTLPASDPQECCGHMALGPPSSCVLTLLGCSLRRGSSCGGFGVSQVLGCRVSAPGGPCRDTAPGPRCSGPGSDLASPRCCLGPSQPILPWNGPHRKEGRGAGTPDEQWCHTRQRCALTQPWEVWLGCGSTGCHCPSTSLCHGPWCHGGTCPELEPALSVAAGGDLAGICLTIACVLSCPHPHARSGGAWISISLFIRGVNTPV